MFNSSDVFHMAPQGFTLNFWGFKHGKLNLSSMIQNSRTPTKSFVYQHFEDSKHVLCGGFPNYFLEFLSKYSGQIIATAGWSPLMVV